MAEQVVFINVVVLPSSWLSNVDKENGSDVSVNQYEDIPNDRQVLYPYTYVCIIYTYSVYMGLQGGQNRQFC